MRENLSASWILQNKLLISWIHYENGKKEADAFKHYEIEAKIWMMLLGWIWALY